MKGLRANIAYSPGSLLVLLSVAGSQPVFAEKLPNLVIILADDLGYGDVGCFGATGFETPNLDKIASQGMVFTDFYSASSVCSPSRAALLTGCYPPRTGITRVLFPYHTIGLNPSETTIAELLKQKKYATAVVGKWHLGCIYPFLPLQNGFDEFFGLPYSNDMWPVNYDGTPVTAEHHDVEWKLGCPPLPLYEGNEKTEVISDLHAMNRLTTMYTNRAVDFIARNKDNPFFLFLSHSMPHVPLGVSETFRGKSRQGMYGDVVMEIDQSVGEIVIALEKYGISRNTWVIFTSDNGPWLNYGNHGGSAGGLREGKESVFEGGFRVPCIMKWPEVIPPGTTCNKIVSTIDILPTIAHFAEVELPPVKIDGEDVLSLLRCEPQANPRREFYYYLRNSLLAVRRDNWKLVLPHECKTNVGALFGKDGSPGTMRTLFTEGGLYNLNTDPGERYDLKDSFPEIVHEMQELSYQIRLDLGDELQKMKGKGVRLPGTMNGN